MANTCLGSDNTAPIDVQQALAGFLVRENLTQGTAYQRRTGRPRTHLDQHDCCILEDLGGTPCRELECRYLRKDGATSATKTDDAYQTRKDLAVAACDWPPPGAPAVQRAARGGRGGLAGRAAGRKRKAARGGRRRGLR